ARRAYKSVVRAAARRGAGAPPGETRNPIMIDMTLEMAETAVRVAQGKARALKAPMTVTVVDEAGRLVLSARGDGTGFFSTETSRARGRRAASFRKRTAELADLVAKGGFWSIAPTVLPAHTRAR